MFMCEITFGGSPVLECTHLVRIASSSFAGCNYKSNMEGEGCVLMGQGACVFVKDSKHTPQITSKWTTVRMFYIPTISNW